MKTVGQVSRAASGLALWLVSSLSLGSGLQVSPVTLSLQSAHGAEGLWLTNTGSSVLHAQARVYHWTQAEGDQLTPSTGLVVSPPMLQLSPGAQQLVRVIRVGAPPMGAGAVEDAFRLSIDELPVQAPEERGLRFVLRYMVPVFVQPAGVGTVTPRLQWSLQYDAGSPVLQAVNSGNGHAQLSDVSFVNGSGQRIEIAGGLAGYVLPGCTRRWVLKPLPDFAGGGIFEARINGASRSTQILSLGSSVR